MISFDWVDGTQMHGIKYLEKMVDLSKMVERVLQNFAHGIYIDDVLKNHLDFCGRHKLMEVIPYAAQTVTDLDLPEDVRQTALTVLASIEDTTEEMRKLFVIVTDDLKWKIARELVVRDAVFIGKELRKIMQNGSEKDGMRAAGLLIELQDLEGLVYYVERIKSIKRNISDPIEGSVIRKIKTKQAIPILINLLEIALDPQFVQDDFYRLDSTILDMLRTIAIESDCYEEISNVVKNFIDVNIAKNDNVRFLYNYLQTLERTYYMNKTEKISFIEASNLAKKLVDS